MKILSLLVLLLLLAALLAPVGHGARSRAGKYLGHPPRPTIQIMRSPQAAHAPKTVRRVVNE